MEQERLIELVQQTQAGDQAATEELLREAYPSVSYQCRKMLKNETDAEDVTQEVLLTAYTKLDTLQEPAAFWGWLNRLTATRCINALSRWHKDLQFAEDEEGNSVLDTFEDLDDQVVPDKAIDNAEMARMVGELVDALPEAQRTCVMLYYYDEMSVKEIAEATGVSDGTVKSRLNYARKSIKEGVEGYEKQGVKLYGLSPLPFLLFFLRKNASAGFSDAARSKTVAAVLSSGATGAGAAAAGSTTTGAVAAGASTAAANTTVAGTAAITAGSAASAAGAVTGAIAKGISAKMVAIVLAGAVAVGGISVGFYIAKYRPAAKAKAYQAQIELGRNHLEEGQYEEAIVAFTTAIEMDPNQVESYIGRGNAYVRWAETEANLTAAQNDYQTAVDIDEQHPEGYLGLADVQIRQGNYEAAQQTVTLGIEKAGEDPNLEKKLEELSLGTISDSSGNVRRVTAFDDDGKLVYWHEYAYGENGNKASITSYNSVGEQTGHVDFAYDTNGRTLVSYNYRKDSGGVGRNDFVRDEDGKVVSSIWYLPDGKFDCQLIYQYNAQDQKICETYMDYNGLVTSYRTFEYDKQGHVTKQTDYSSYGGITGYTLYSYDDAGRETGYYEYDSTGALLYQRIKNYGY